MKKSPLLLFQLFIAAIFLFSISFTSAQCPSGVTMITGSGCGCLSGCNLSSLGGPNCSPPVSGNCTPQLMTATIEVPAGCTYTVTALIANRPNGCTSSGADASDYVLVDVAGGSKAETYGGANGLAQDSYTLTGPGTIVCSGYVNRADEIMTYSTTSVNCPNCMITLPVELISFDAFQEGQAVACTWQTFSEKDNDFFTIERSTDGMQFEYVGQLRTTGNSQQVQQYKLYDYNPYYNITSYYRLSQTDFNGLTRYHEIKAVNLKTNGELVLFPNPTTSSFVLMGDSILLSETTVTDLSGRKIYPTESGVIQNKLTFERLASGIYTVCYFDGVSTKQIKVLVTN